MSKQGSSNDPQPPPEPSWNLVIRFVGQTKDVVIPLKSAAQLKDVSTAVIRREIRTQVPLLARKRLKLIHNGRVLMNHTDFEHEMRFYKSNEEDGDEPINVYIHCLVGDDLSAAELAEEEEHEKQPEKSTTEAPKGFDRLLSQGFSQQDIGELRDQFRRIHSAYLANQSDDTLRELEDRWIDSTVNHEIDEFPANLEGGGTPNPAVNAAGAATLNTGFMARENNVHKELFVGVCVGFFLGVFALFLMCMNIGGVFNKRTRMAIVSGVIVNFTFGVLKAWY